MKIASSSEIALFQERGFIVIKNAFSKNLLTKFKETLKTLLDAFIMKFLTMKTLKKLCMMI